jgi:hypothetical protein
MKLARLTDARFHEALRKLSAQPMPLRVAFKLKGLKTRVDEELKKFEQCRQEALDKFGKKDADGKLVTRPDNTVEFEEGQLQAFAAELNDLGQTDVDLPSIKLDDLGSTAELTVDELTLLDSVVVE